MPISTAPARADAPLSRNGFTLVELMIALAILGLLTGVAVLTLGGSEREPADSAARLAGRLAAARDRAVMTGHSVGVWVSPSGYGFDERRQGRWQPIGDRPFETADLKNGIAIVAFGTAGTERARLRFDPLGMPDRPQQLVLSKEARRVVVDISASGEITLQ